MDYFIKYFEQSLKQYRDLRNVVLYAEEKGIEKGIKEKTIAIIKVGLEKNLSLELLAELTQISINEVKKIIDEQGWEV